MILPLILAVSVVLVGTYIWKFFRDYVSVLKSIHNLPGPASSSFVVGNIKECQGAPENVFKALRNFSKEYYPIYKHWIVHYAAANVMHPNDFETILSDMKHNSKTIIYDSMLKNWLGTGLLTSSGNKWQARRKILTPSFHFNILQDFIKVFVKETDQLVKELKKECHKPHVNVNDYIVEFTLNTIGETAMGTSFDTTTVSGKEYKKAVKDIGQMIVFKLTRPYFMNKLLYMFTKNYYRENKLVKILHKFTTDIINERDRNFKPLQQNVDDSTYSKRKRLAMLDLLLTAKKEQGLIDDEGIREEVDTFMFEGHDTTSVAICYALMLLACHKEIQDRVVEEIQAVFGGGEQIDYKSLQELKYLERTIKEVLRLYPSVPFIARLLGDDIVTYSGHRLKAGSMVHMHIYDLHRNPDIYPDPEKFDPDRFLPENSKDRHNFAYVPFSAGSRNCIGQKFAMLEIKTVLCGILSEYVLEPVDTPSTITIIADLVLRTKDGIRVKFVPREERIMDVRLSD